MDETIFNYQANYAQWSFLRREYLRNRKLPTNAEELEWMLQRRPTKEYVHLMRSYQRLKLKLEREEETRLNGGVASNPRKMTWKERQARRQEDRSLE